MQNTNLLINEKSPYLLQHAHNPVNWHPWCDDAFKKAKEQDKPVFLSIGYSACHWCHVMEEESFKDTETAKVLNDHFICIKVDREERPDIDAVYMDACQMLTGSGGWPLTVYLTPEQKPFYAATYLPKSTLFGRIGLIELSQKIDALWKNDRQQIINAAEYVKGMLIRTDKLSKNSEKNINLLCDEAYRFFSENFDEKNGGFNGAPKFPSPHNLLFLLKYYNYFGEENAKQMVEKTLTQMYRGGIFDHIGGGFSRYSTDEKYLVPHFEKMLYDNALIMYAYAFYLQEERDNELFKYVVNLTAEYVLRELTDEKGGFYCAQDADSEKKEGYYYLLDKKTIFDNLQQSSAKEICQLYNINDKGHLEGYSVANLLSNSDYFYAHKKMQKVKDKLLMARQKKEIFTDKKILTCWNGLMIAAFAKAGLVLEKKEYIDAAKKAAEYLKKYHVTQQGKVFRMQKGRHNTGQLDDYAFYAFGLLELYNSTFEVSFLKDAISLTEVMIKEFFDNEEGGYFMNPPELNSLIKRPKEFYDGAMPSGNSAVLYVLNKLSRITADKNMLKAYGEQTKLFVLKSQHYSAAYAFALFSLLDFLTDGYEIVVTSKNEKINLDKLQKWAGIKNVSVILKTPSFSSILDEIVPCLSNYYITDKTMYYICKGGGCQKPTENLDEVLKLLSAVN